MQALPSSTTYLDASGKFKTLENLILCRYSKLLRSEENCDIHIEGYICPQSLSGIAKNECLASKGKSNAFWQCPCCFNVLQVKSDNKIFDEKTGKCLGNLNDPSLDQMSVEAGQQTEIKRVFYLYCNTCAWSSRDVNLEDKVGVSNPSSFDPWEVNLNLHEKFYTEMKSFMSETVTTYLKEVADRDRLIEKSKEAAKHRSRNTNLGRTSDNPLINLIANKFTTNSSSYFSNLNNLPEVSASSVILKTVDSNEPHHKQKFPKQPEFPSVTDHLSEEFKTGLEIDFQADETELDDLIFNSNPDRTNLEQRLAAPQQQPSKVTDFRPLPGPLLLQRSLKYDRHRLLKPEYSAQIIKPKISSLADATVPSVSVLRDYNPTSQIVSLLITNPNYRATNVFLLPFHLLGKLSLSFKLFGLFLIMAQFLGLLA